MPRKSKPGSKYPDNWKKIATAIKDSCGWAGVRCGAAHDPAPGHTLGIHHLDMDPSNNAWYNLLPLCSACHLSIQSRVNLDRPWVMQEHSDWFKPYVAGHYAAKYLGVELTREQVTARLDELLQLERRAVLGVPS